jgi:hypothetical protein
MRRADTGAIERWLWIVLCAVILVPIAWGADAQAPWDIDHIAPGAVLKALAARFGSGWAPVYGPLPYEIVGAVYAPLLALARLTGELGVPRPDWPFGFRHPDAAMFVLVLAARLVSAAMAATIAWFTMRDEPNPRARWIVPLLFMGSPLFVYYAKTSNVDMQALFWIWLAFRTVERAATWRGFAVAALAATAVVLTKEQFAPLSVTVIVAAALGAWRAAQPRKGVRVPAALGVIAIAALAYAIAWVLPLNLSGWKAHHHYLFHEAKYPRTFAANLAGFFGLARAFVLELPYAIGWPATWGAVVGVLVRAEARDLRLRAIGCAIYVGVFLSAIGYVYPRFLLPLLIVGVPLASRGVMSLLAFPRLRRMSIAAAAFVLAGIVAGPYLDWIMLRDRRLDAERWIRAHVPEGSRIELAGNTHYLPRVPHERPRIETYAPNLVGHERAPVGDVVVLSSLDSYLFQADSTVRRTWWDALSAVDGRYRLATEFRQGRIDLLIQGIPVGPSISIFVRREGAAASTLRPNR